MEESFAEGEAFVEAETNTKKSDSNEVCLNCGTKRVGKFCHHCGQKDIPRRQVIGDLISNFVEAFTNFDGKFLQTTKYLILKPGFLAIEYNKGKRETYFHPVRMYTFASFLFFLLFVLLPNGDNDAVDAGLSKEDREELAKVGLDSNLNYNDSIRKKNDIKFSFAKEYKDVKEYDSIQNTLAEDDRDGWVKRKFVIRGIELNKRYKRDTHAFSESFGDFFKENFSTVLFFLMPLFAWLMKLLYVHRDYFYAEHLVFTIYYYNFFYLAGALMMIFNVIPNLGTVSVVLGIWIFFYLLFAMKRMYGQGWGKTILKFSIFNFLFMILVVLGIVVLALLAILFV
jgi:hypothetical protein